MSPRSRKLASRRSEFVVPFGCLKIHGLYKQGMRAQRATDKRLITLMNEIKLMQRQFNSYSGPTIVRWEEYLPFGGNVLRGERSKQDYTESWTCMCGAENGPSRRRLFDIPALECRLCGLEADDNMDFDFVYDSTLLNGIPTIRKIRQQNKSNCAKYAWTAAAEIDEAIELALDGKIASDHPGTLAARDLVKKHRMYQGRIRKANKRLENFHIEVSNSQFDLDEFDLVGAITKVCGIRTEGTEKKKIHKIESCMKLDKNDFAEICTAIADGPVVATFRAGENLSDLAFGQVYKATDLEKFLAGNYKDQHHAVVLVGAGRRRRKRYFHFLNSWGKKFCIRVSKNEQILPGGIGMIRVSDLSSDPIHIRRKPKI